MKREFWLWQIVLCLACILPSGAGAQPAHPDRDYFGEGKLFANSDQWEKALRTWYQGRVALEMQGISDPRIGINFIELATEKRAAQYYGSASDMYLWGFSNFDFDEHASTVRLEIQRLLPLLPESEREEWQKALDAGDAKAIYHLIRNFWLERDPTPTTPGNERLIEHWERIAYARTHFRRNIRLPYLTDDRGTIYVKYGEPQKKKAGRMGSSQTELLRLIDDLGARNEIMQYDEHPEYELWVYTNLDPVRGIFFLFGEEGGNGPFKLLDGVEDLISTKAFSIYSERLTGIRAAYYLQMVYYSELRMMDSFFENRYLDMDYEWSKQRGPNKRKLKDQYQMYVSENQYNPIYKYAPPERSSFEDQYSQITVNTRLIRLLDENNRQKLAILVFSSPRIRGGDVQIVDKQVIKIPEFYVKNTLILRDAELNEMRREEAKRIRGLDNTAIFVVENLEGVQQMVVAAEALPLRPIAPGPNKSGQINAFAMGKADIKLPAPLSTHPDSLEVSDLIFGIDFPSEIDPESVPFPILPVQMVQKTDPARVYLEVYHLAGAPGEQGQFRIEFKIVRRGSPAAPVDQREMIASAFDFESQGRRSKEYFGVDLQSLGRGMYEIIVEVTDKKSGQRKARKATFSVYEASTQ